MLIENTSSGKNVLKTIEIVDAKALYSVLKGFMDEMVREGELSDYGYSLDTCDLSTDFPVRCDTTSGSYKYSFEIYIPYGKEYDYNDLGSVEELDIGKIVLYIDIFQPFTYKIPIYSYYSDCTTSKLKELDTIYVDKDNLDNLKNRIHSIIAMLKETAKKTTEEVASEKE